MHGEEKERHSQGADVSHNPRPYLQVTVRISPAYKHVAHVPMVASRGEWWRQLVIRGFGNGTAGNTLQRPFLSPAALTPSVVVGAAAITGTGTTYGKLQLSPSKLAAINAGKESADMFLWQHILGSLAERKRKK